MEPSDVARAENPASASVRPLMRVLRRAAPRLSTLLVVGSVGLALITPAMAYTGKRMMDALVERSAASATRWIVIELALMVLVALSSSLTQDLARLIKLPLAVSLATELALAQAEIDPAALEEPLVRSRLARARATAERHAGELIDDALAVLQGLISLVLFGILLAAYAGWPFVLALAAAPAYAMERWAARAVQQTRAQQSRDRLGFDSVESALLSSRWAAETRFLRIAPWLLSRMRLLAERFYGADRMAWRRRVVPVSVAHLLPGVAFYGLYGVLAMRAAASGMSLGTMTLCLISFNNSQRFARAALAATSRLEEGRRRLTELFALLHRAPRAAAAPAPAIARDGSARGLVLENVGFRHARSEAWILRRLDLAVAPGELIAIVGGNGAGKTTLLKLMSGLLRPREGRVLLDGRDLRSWEPAALRGRYAIVFQDHARHGLTLRENLSLGLPVVVSDAELESACRRAGLAEVLARLPHGLDTELSRAFGQGVELSGGQWQKVAIARALLRGQAELLILDEPTSALDERAELQVLAELRGRAAHQSTILVTHRPAALAIADRTLSLERGRLVPVAAPAPEAPVYRPLRS